MKYRFLVLCFTLAFVPIQTMAQESKPVLIEMFSSVTCPDDQNVQYKILDILKNYPDAVLVNCRTGAGVDKGRKDSFSKKTCDEKSIQYFQNLGLFGLKSPMVIVNGKYDAYAEAIPAAIDMAQSVDRIQKIGLSLKDGTLYLDIPDMGVSKGEITLYAYAPTQKNQVVVQPQLPAGQAALPATKPFESSPEPVEEFYVRPVVSIEKIVDWNGKEKTMTYPLSKNQLFQSKKDDLSYVAVLNNEEGDVIALGELVSAAETKAFAWITPPQETP